MYRRHLRRRRSVLVVLVVSCLVLISTHFSEGESGPLHSVQNGVGAVLGPLEEGASKALKPARDLVNWFDETFEARGENDRLREEVQSLRQELVETRARLVAGIAANDVAEIVDGTPLEAYDRVEARLASRSSSTWNQTVVIDQGRGAGISVEDAVITGDGLIGRVSSVTGGAARVALITHEESAVTATVLEDGRTGLLGPELGDPDDLLFSLYEQGDRGIANGAELITAGFTEGELSSRFPPGIPIGEVQEDNPAEQERTQQVHVDPFADLANLDRVTVLSGGSG